MNHYQATQLQNGKWIYAYTRNNETFRAASCTSCLGHDSKEEANEHFKWWLVSNATFNEKLRHTTECEICQTLTRKVARTYLSINVPLCSEHMNPESLASVLCVDYIISSV